MLIVHCKPDETRCDKPLTEDVSQSPLYSPDLAPVPAEHRTWNKWNLAALWVGMAVLYPNVYSGFVHDEVWSVVAGGAIIIGWQISLSRCRWRSMVMRVYAMAYRFRLSGAWHLARKGYLCAVVCAWFGGVWWFGVQTWIGGLAFYSIWNAITYIETASGLSIGKFIALRSSGVNMYLSGRHRKHQVAGRLFRADFDCDWFGADWLGISKRIRFYDGTQSGEQLQLGDHPGKHRCDERLLQMGLRLQPIKNRPDAQAKEFQTGSRLRGDNTIVRRFQVGSRLQEIQHLCLMERWSNIDNAGLCWQANRARASAYHSRWSASWRSNNKYIYSSMIDGCKHRAPQASCGVIFCGLRQWWVLGNNVAQYCGYYALCQSQHDQIVGQSSWERPAR